MADRSTRKEKKVAVTVRCVARAWCPLTGDAMSEEACLKCLFAGQIKMQDAAPKIPYIFAVECKCKDKGRVKG